MIESSTRRPAAFRLIILSACLVLPLCVSPSRLQAKTTITVPVTSNLETSYLTFMGNRTPAQVSSFKSPHATRNVVSLVLIQKALELGGMSGVEYEFHVVPNSERERAEVKSGRTVIGSQDYWEHDFDVTVYKSEPVILDGTFEKGIYTHPSNASMLAVRSWDALKNHSAVILGTWKGDVAALRALGINQVHEVYEFQAIPRFLALNRADFTLLEFSSTPDMSLPANGATLVPVPGIKVILPGNRCWMVSKTHPLGEQVFEALSKGLRTLHRNGTLKRALTESGFFQERVKNWRVINR